MDFCRSKGWSTHPKIYFCFLSTSNSSHSVQFFNFFFQKIPSLDIAIKKLRDAGHFRAPTLNSTLPHSSFHPLTLITRAFYNERNSRPFSLALSLSLSFGISIKIIHKFFFTLILPRAHILQSLAEQCVWCEVIWTHHCRPFK